VTPGWAGLRGTDGTGNGAGEAATQHGVVPEPALGTTAARPARRLGWAPWLIAVVAFAAYCVISISWYSAAFVAVSLLCLVALVLMIRLIRKPPAESEPAEAVPAESRSGAGTPVSAPQPRQNE
jgi:hypothetical protein